MKAVHVLAVAAAVVAVGCAQSSFNGTGGKKAGVAPKTQDSKPQPPAPAPGPQPLPGIPAETPNTPGSETFAMTSHEGLIDMVWLIDNSGSMKEEAQQVRDNFEKFLTSIQARSDMKIALVSTKAGSGLGGSTGVTLPASAAAKGIQVDAFVDSNNALVMAALATCPAASTSVPGAEPNGGFPDNFDPVKAKICGKDTQLDTFTSSLYQPVVGSLASFFRAEAKKVYVVVTDDEAEEVNDTNFLSLIDAYKGAATPTVFSFIGFESKANCSISRRGTAYEKLATATQGAVFDICETDWSKNFDQLSKAVIGLAKLQFTLKASKVGKVISVVVDGRTLATNEYTVAGSVINLDPKAVPQGAKTLVVNFEI